jgi:SSS family solute:Na+ symporter
MGMFWKRATSMGALSAALGSAVFSVILKFAWPELPFMDRVGLVFLLCLALCYFVSIMGKPTDEDSSVSLDKVSFATTKHFNVAAVCLVVVLSALYTTWW